MAYIKVEVGYTIKNGSKVSFKAPCDCNTVAGLKVYFPTDNGIRTYQTFLFADAHGNNLTGIGHLFAKGAVVKAILSLDSSRAYLQNADTNKYLEDKFTAVNTAATNAASAAAKAQTAATAAQNTANSKAPMYTYGTEDIQAGSASPYEDGHLHFVYE